MWDLYRVALNKFWIIIELYFSIKEIFEFCFFEFQKLEVRSCKNNAKRTIYLAFDIEKEQKLITQLGKCKYGRSCLYVNKLVDIDIKTLRKLTSISR